MKISFFSLLIDPSPAPSHFSPSLTFFFFHIFLLSRFFLVLLFQPSSSLSIACLFSAPLLLCRLPPASFSLPQDSGVGVMSNGGGVRRGRGSEAPRGPPPRTTKHTPRPGGAKYALPPGATRAQPAGRNVDNSLPSRRSRGAPEDLRPLSKPPTEGVKIEEPLQHPEEAPPPPRDRRRASERAPPLKPFLSDRLLRLPEPQ